jgi:hypothetical protein
MSGQRFMVGYVCGVIEANEKIGTFAGPYNGEFSLLQQLDLELR